MGYVKTMLCYGVSVDDDTWNEEYVNTLKEMYKVSAKEKDDIDIDIDDIDSDDYEFNEYLEGINMITNYGYYHSEMTFGFEIDSEDSDIRSGQDFNYELRNIPTKAKLNNILKNNKETIDKLGLKEKDFSLYVMVYNY